MNLLFLSIQFSGTEGTFMVYKSHHYLFLELSHHLNQNHPLSSPFYSPFFPTLSPW